MTVVPPTSTLGDVENLFPITFSIQTREDGGSWVAELHMDVDTTHETIFTGPVLHAEPAAVADLAGAVADYIRRHLAGDL